ncbi:hypothetical protein HOC35_03080 [Candidatus Woesearchaeota archaeon]|jgi:hypothetical protein|nr:hypothetical protein [Candidatus Woesearchaeota archaeon]
MVRKITNNGADDLGVVPSGVDHRTFSERKWPSATIIVGNFSKSVKSIYYYDFYRIKQKQQNDI